MERKPKNMAEGLFYELMTSQGWEVSKKGWPDFICYKDGKVILVEIKPRRSHNLKREQYRCMLALTKLGVPCYRWTPDGAFEKILLEPT